MHSSLFQMIRCREESSSDEADDKRGGAEADWLGVNSTMKLLSVNSLRKGKRYRSSCHLAKWFWRRFKQLPFLQPLHASFCCVHTGTSDHRTNWTRPNCSKMLWNGLAGKTSLINFVASTGGIRSWVTVWSSLPLSLFSSPCARPSTTKKGWRRSTSWVQNNTQESPTWPFGLRKLSCSQYIFRHDDLFTCSRTQDFESEKYLKWFFTS